MTLDYNKLFSCSKCGNIRAIFFLKVAGSKIIIKQKCQKHGVKVIKLFVELFIKIAPFQKRL